MNHNVIFGIMIFSTLTNLFLTLVLGRVARQRDENLRNYLDELAEHRDARVLVRQLTSELKLLKLKEARNADA